MGTAKRIGQIISANINHLVDKAEDPEKMLKQLIREMDENIISLRMEVARAIAGEKRLARRIAATTSAVHTWQENSEKAVSEGDDALSKQAIARRLYEEKLLAGLEEQHKKALDASETMKEQLRLLENKIQDARRNKEVLIARKRGAQAQKEMLKATQKFSRISKRTDALLADTILESPVSMESLEEEVVELETEAEAMREVLNGTPDLESVFRETKQKEEIETILRDLKEKARKQKNS